MSGGCALGGRTGRLGCIVFDGFLGKGGGGGDGCRGAVDEGFRLALKRFLDDLAGYP